MSGLSKLTRLIGFAVIFLTIAVAGAGFFIVRSDVEKMRESGRENLLWTAVQIEIELMRFQSALAHFGVEAPNGAPSTPQFINDRFDILWSRVSLFQQGTVGQRLRIYDERQATVATLFAKMKEVEPQVVDLQPGDMVAAQSLERIFDPFAIDLRRLSRDVLHGEEQISATQRENLSRSSSLLFVLSAIAVLASLLMIFFFARETRQLRVLAQMNERLLQAANKAGQAKSQFLAMMSHELRTPMNGVLGLLALVKQRGLTDPQNRLVDQAERSGRQMITLLGDILDFSALQDGRLKLENKPFSPDNLVRAVVDVFLPVANREGIVFEAHADENCPRQVVGDFHRMRQALTHLATYLLETAGTRNIALDLSYEKGCLNAAISFEYSQTGGEWEPALMMGDPERSSEGFASEALGPAVSRGLIERMGGTTKLFNPSNERVAVLVVVPAKELVVDTLRILVVSQSTTLEVIFRAALSNENVQFLESTSSLSPHVVILEAGGEYEAEQIENCIHKHPEAILVALGRPMNPEVFDDIVEVPIDIATIQKAGFMRLVSGNELAQSKKLRYAGNDKTT